MPWTGDIPQQCPNLLLTTKETGAQRGWELLWGHIPPPTPSRALPPSSGALPRIHRPEFPQGPGAGVEGEVPWVVSPWGGPQRKAAC